MRRRRQRSRAQWAPVHAVLDIVEKESSGGGRDRQQYAVYADADSRGIRSPQPDAAIAAGKGCLDMNYEISQRKWQQ